MSAVKVVGVRHHSPACARLVRHVILRDRPRFVLVEGPSDMNDRLDEIERPHRMPIALFSYRQEAESRGSRGIWTPFCDYSPEWVALDAAREVGATPLFIDLPAWDNAFASEVNRYSDHHARRSVRLAELCARLGMEDTDALWEHLFEQPWPLEELELRLDRYFEDFRGDEVASEMDAPREATMLQWIDWAVAESDGKVVVVCGGYHKPALERGWNRSTTRGKRVKPSLPSTGSARVGSYLVPFSFRRLDSFTGYASGMPSPEFHQRVWEEGPEQAAEEMLFVAAQHLRKKAQRVSAADLIAAKTLSSGLQLLRGHQALARVDVLDGLAGALIKEALDVPLPWAHRGVIASGTDPLLVELVAAFSGARVGELAPGTPRPPLVDDAFAELERVGVEVERKVRSVTADLQAPKGVQRSRILHRLRVLSIPGFKRTRAPSVARRATDLTETWEVQRLLETDAALIEAAALGGSLESAAHASLEERCQPSAPLNDLATALIDAALAGIEALAQRWLARISLLIASEPSLAVLGATLARLVALGRGEVVFGGRQLDGLSTVIELAFDRGLWLLEGITGANAPFDEGIVAAVLALRESVRLSERGEPLDLARAHAVCNRRVDDPEAPAMIRGATLGLLWSTRRVTDEDDEARAVRSFSSLSDPNRMGDFLAGLFMLARDRVISAPALLEAIDRVVVDLDREGFLLVLPAFRLAFSFFPPRERMQIAEALVGVGGATGIDPSSLVHARVDLLATRRGMELDQAAALLAHRFGLADPSPPGAAQ